MSSYLPHTQAEVKAMLEAIGVKSIDDLFAEIPAELRLNRPLDLPDGLSESEVVDEMNDLAQLNYGANELLCFLGAGIYDHYIPSAINHLLLRGDFFTAYTPYQAEISQGTLQAIYEYQSLICGLTGMDVSNASMYEAGTALVEALNMAKAQTGRTRVVIPETVHPEYRRVAKTINTQMGIEIVTVPFEDGVTDMAKLAEVVNDSTAAVVAGYPNFFGSVEDLEALANVAHNVGALLVVTADPVSLGLLTAPGDLGADIVCGEGQSLGIPMSFGGPSLGFMACKEALLRKVPGRITGATVDKTGRRGFVLTLQAREQHIRREKAGSNICSNQALMALNATIYMSLLGRDGIRDVANQSFQKAHHLKKELAARVPAVSFPFAAPFMNEFVIKVPNAKKLLLKMAKQGVLGGVALERWFPTLKDHLLVAVTEKRTAEDIDYYCELLGGLTS
ncbi:MAG TPA: aminomethyl-transferring glycine dehydrogenase subunit GcvPA [Candidatus Ozemobacteraceae bacterium]|nr:aminomethyl-transferring glycine dehydrogenase subunit GcvPA [Candidatus Ozemobacteraceae bacterium]